MTRTENNFPVVVTGENCLYYSVISNYMNTKSKVVKVDKKLAEQATGVRSKQRQGRGEGAVIGEEEHGANKGEGAVLGLDNLHDALPICKPNGRKTAIGFTDRKSVV